MGRHPADARCLVRSALDARYPVCACAPGCLCALHTRDLRPRAPCLSRLSPTRRLRRRAPYIPQRRRHAARYAARHAVLVCRAPCRTPRPMGRAGRAWQHGLVGRAADSMGESRGRRCTDALGARHVMGRYSARHRWMPLSRDAHLPIHRQAGRRMGSMRLRHTSPPAYQGTGPLRHSADRTAAAPAHSGAIQSARDTTAARAPRPGAPALRVPAARRDAAWIHGPKHHLFRSGK